MGRSLHESRVVALRHTAVEESRELRRALQVAVIQPLDREARLFDQAGNVTVQMAAAEQTLLDAVQAILPAYDLRIVSTAMLDEVEASVRSERAPHLEERTRDVRDRTERERADDRCEARIGHWQLLRRQANRLDGERCRRDSLSREP